VDGHDYKAIRKVAQKVSATAIYPALSKPLRCSTNFKRGVGMPTLRIDQQPGSGAGIHRIAVNAEVPGLQPLSFSREIEFALSLQERNGSDGILKTISNSTKTRRRRSPCASKGLWPNAGRRCFARSLRGGTTPYSSGRWRSSISLRRGSRSRPAWPRRPPSRGS
jgi:hypothetical protein